MQKFFGMTQPMVLVSWVVWSHTCYVFLPLTFSERPCQGQSASANMVPGDIRGSRARAALTLVWVHFLTEQEEDHNDPFKWIIFNKIYSEKIIYRT